MCCFCHFSSAVRGWAFVHEPACVFFAFWGVSLGHGSPLVSSVLGSCGGLVLCPDSTGRSGGKALRSPTLTIFSSSCGLWAFVLWNLENTPEGSKLCHHLFTLPGFLVPSPARWTSLYCNDPFKSHFLLKELAKRAEQQRTPETETGKFPFSASS